LITYSWRIVRLSSLNVRNSFPAKKPVCPTSTRSLEFLFDESVIRNYWSVTGSGSVAETGTRSTSIVAVDILGFRFQDLCVHTMMGWWG
jgi:hypothetical protein